MSHVATVALEVKDVAALRAACASLGLELREGQRTFKWFGKWVRDYHGADAAYRTIDPSTFGTCEHAVAVKGNPNAYEIGVVRRTDGKLALAWDFYGSAGRAIESVAGKGCVNLVRAYATEVAKRTLCPKGYAVGGTKTLADGTHEVVFVKA
jgi:hypothetical protein